MASEDVQLGGQGGMSMAQVATIVADHWKASVVIAVCVLVLAAIVTAIMPKTFTSTATLIVNYQDTDPLAGKIFPAGIPVGFISTQIELMRSPEVLDPVIERLGLISDPDYTAGSNGGASTLREWVEAKLRKNLDIEQGPGGSELIYVRASATTASQAADVANAVADGYSALLSERVSGPANERAKRYAVELGDLKKKVALAQDAVTKFRARTGEVDLDTKVDLDMDILTQLEHRLLDARNALRSRQALASGNQEVSSQVLTSTRVQSLRDEEAKLKSRMAQLRTMFGPNYPQVVELQSQIDANRSSLEAALATYSNAATSDIVISNNEVASLEKALAAQRQKVLQSRRDRDEAAKYELELESAQAVYKRALDGYDEIMFASTANLANVSIASRARIPAKADKPNVLKNLLLGALVAIVLGLGAPFVYELLNRRVRCRDDVERDFGIPILTEFQAIKLAPAAGA